MTRWPKHQKRLWTCWNRSGTKRKARAAEEETDLQRLIAGEGRNHKVEPWDWRYYAEKLRNERFAFDEAELKPYLQLEKIIEACFDVATRLFGIRSKRKPAFRPGILMSASGKFSMRMAASVVFSLATISIASRSALAHG